ncbi:ribbon-helix-helix domain-containing protein [Thiolapillus sp.]
MKAENKVTIRMDDIMKDAVDKMAEQRGITVSDYIRHLIISDINNVNRYKRNNDGYAVWDTIGDKPHII